MLDIPQVLLADAAKIVGVEINTLKSWIARGAVELTRADQKPVGRGGRMILTIRTLYTLAFMAELTSYGYAPGRAGLAAKVFTHHPFTYGEPMQVRNGGELFPEGETLLVVFRPGESVPGADPRHIVGHSVRSRFVNVRTSADYAELNQDLAAERSAIVLNCNSICAHVDEGLRSIRVERGAGQQS